MTNKHPSAVPSPKLSAQTPVNPELSIHGSRQWVSWQAEQKLSVAFTTYQSSKAFFIGLNPDGKLSVFERTFAHCMGMTAHADSLFLSSQYQIWRLNNLLPPGQCTREGYDRVYVPNISWVTGDVDTHDLGVLENGRPIFVNTLFSCLATVGEDCSFRPLWQPKFITQLVAEDRCHLNGLAMDAGKARFVTSVSQSNVHEGWRDHRHDGGVVIDVDSQEVVVGGLSMPHSPRCYQKKLWLLNSGTGEFGWVDTQAGRFEPVAFCPGYARGLAFHGDFALIGLSRPRESRTFEGLALDQRLADEGVSARCGIQVVDLRSGTVAHTLSIDGLVQELYDVVVLPDVQRPSAIGLMTDEIRRTILMGAAQDSAIPKA